VTWPPPELDDGVEDGELRPLDDELDELPELVLVPLDVLPEVLELPEPEVVCWVLLDPELEDAWWVAPGRLNATVPAAITLAAAAETVTARSRAAPRSRSLAPGPALRGEPLWWWVMAVSLPARSRRLLWATSQPAMSVGGVVGAGSHLRLTWVDHGCSGSVVKREAGCPGPGVAYAPPSTPYRLRSPGGGAIRPCVTC
jgi:hypothetical protein